MSNPSVGARYAAGTGSQPSPALICEMFTPCPHGLRPTACPYCLQTQTDGHQPWWKCGVLIGVGPLALGRQPMRCRRWRWHFGACRD